MKKFWERNKNVIILLVVWRLAFVGLEKIAPFVFPPHEGYIGPIPLANHDGIYYLLIAGSGYHQFTQSFFPLYPILILYLSKLSMLSSWITASLLSYVSFFIAIILFHDTLTTENKKTAWRTILFLIAFPTSFFFSAVYTEGVFFLLSVLVFISVRKKMWFLVGLFGALASATRLFGVLLFFYAIIEYFTDKKIRIRLWDILCICLIPVGLISYMVYLYYRYGDPLLFFHLQPLFGANRSGSSMILLPQVVWRYLKILFTAYLQPTPQSYFITVIEFVATVFGYTILFIGWKIKVRWSYILYSLAALTLPTLTGTFSSMPRYMLTIFPLFLILGKLDNTLVRLSILVISVILQLVLSVMFIRGWFVA